MLIGRLLYYLKKKKKRKFSRNGHSLSLVFIRCHSLYHSLSFVVTRCHSLSLVVPLVVTRCTTRLSFYKRSSNYPSDERNKLFSFQIKATLKATTLGVRMCSTELLLWKNQESSTCYPMTLFKWDSTADIFLKIFNIFWTSYFKKQLQITDCKGFYLLRMWNDYCFRGIPEKWDSEP